MEKFSGTLSECLKDFFKKISDGDSQTLTIAKSLGPLSLTQIELWKSGDGKPLGLLLVKAVYCLDLAGYEISELKIHPKVRQESIRCMIKMLALNLIAPKEAIAAIGYSNESDLYRAILGTRGGGVSQDRAVKIANLVSRQNLTDKTAEKTADQEPDKPKGKEIEFEFISSSKTGDKHHAGIPAFNEQVAVDLIHSLGSISYLLEKMVDYYVSEATPAERQELRNKLGNDERGIFRISNSFFRVAEKINALCTEKSLETYNQRKGDK